MHVRKKRLCGIPGTEGYKFDEDGHFEYNFKNPRPVICIETGKEFLSVSSAAKYYNINPKSLSHALNGTKTGKGKKYSVKSSGFDPETGKTLHWRFIDGTNGS